MIALLATAALALWATITQQAAVDTVVVARPFPGPQTWGLSCPVREIFFGGARGGGKSRFIILRWLAHAARSGGKARGFVARRTMEQLRDFQLECEAMLPDLGWTYTVKGNKWRGPDGCVLTLAYLENDKDAEQYQGWNLSFVAIDEAGNFPSPAPIDMLRATLRLPGVEHLLTITGNPGGVGHRWLKERYITGHQPMKPFMVKVSVPKDDGSGYEDLESECVFIPSRLKDNPACNTPEYKVSLARSGPAWLVKAWLEGDWDVQPAGGLFDVDKINFGTPGPVERRIHGWDTALSTKTSADESARLEIGRDDARRTWIMDAWHGRLDPGAVGRKIVEDAVLREVRWVRCEGGPAGLACEHVVRDTIFETSAPVMFELTSHMNDKVAKNAAFMAMVNTGQVWIPGTKENPPEWWPSLRDELLTFDGVDGKKDNQVDAGGVAFREIDRVIATSPEIPTTTAPPERSKQWFAERQVAQQRKTQDRPKTWRR